MKKPHYQSESRCIEAFSEYCASKVAYSGAGTEDKLDCTLHCGKLNNYKISNKHTFKPSFSVNLKDWDKDLYQARFNSCKLIRRVELEDPATGKLRAFIIQEEEDYLEAMSADG